MKRKSFRRIKSMIRNRWSKPIESITCSQADEFLNAFLEDTLPVEAIRVYLNHVLNCEECFEELEMMYMVDHTLLYLDTEEEFSGDLQYRLQQELSKQKTRINVHDTAIKTYRYLTVIALLIASLAVFDFFGLIEITRLL